MSGDHGTQEDLQFRLDGLRTDPDRKLVVVFGSGLSNMVLPNVEQMVDIFRATLPHHSLQRFDEVVKECPQQELAYQNAASLVKRRLGDSRVARAVRQAVLQARTNYEESIACVTAADIAKCKELERGEGWRIPEGYRQFAEFYGSLPGGVGGPIITTNFDPLIEVALRSEGIAADSVPVPFDSLPTANQIERHSGVPVLHIHGFWTDNSTLNTISQLTKARPKLEGMLRTLFTGAIVLVLGYRGWQDTFMECLKARVREADAMGAEILWAAHESNPDEVLHNSVLRDLDGAPQFTLYFGVDGHNLFRAATNCIAEVPIVTSEEAIIDQPNPYGYTRLPIPVYLSEHEPERFIEGRQPSWADASPGRFPELDATKILRRELDSWLDKVGGGGVIAIGPVGEGKSLAIRQVALQLATDRPDWTVLWRETGAPPITTEWLTDAHAQYGNLVICADEADLISDQLIACGKQWRSPGSGIAFLLASHDRLWWNRGSSLRQSLTDILFHGLSFDDSREIVSAWARFGLLLPEGDPGDYGTMVEDYSNRLFNSSKEMVDSQHSTLFGAILDVRFGEGLRDRVEDLVDKLSRISVHKDSTVNLGEIFSAICIMQDTLDRYGGHRRGISRSIIARMVGLPTIFSDGKILRLLGREAAITYAGGRIYSRHPAIARTVVDHLRSEQRAAGICKLIGRAGGELRNAGDLDGTEYNDAYRLCRSLTREAEARAAATGAVEGASGLLEPRVTTMAVLRQFHPEEASQYAARLAVETSQKRDYGSAIRGYLVEYSYIAQRVNEPYFGIGLAASAMCDGIGYTLTAKQLVFSLVSLLKAAVTVRAQNEAAAGHIPEYCYTLMSRSHPEELENHLRGYRHRLSDFDRVERLSSDVILRRLQDAVRPAIMATSKRMASPIIDHRVSSVITFEDVRRLITAAHSSLHS